jgi:hypothetical protein
LGVEFTGTSASWLLEVSASNRFNDIVAEADHLLAVKETDYGYDDILALVDLTRELEAGYYESYKSKDVFALQLGGWVSDREYFLDSYERMGELLVAPYEGLYETPVALAYLSDPGLVVFENEEKAGQLTRWMAANIDRMEEALR